MFLSVSCVVVSLKTHNVINQFVQDIQFTDIEPDGVGK